MIVEQLAPIPQVMVIVRQVEAQISIIDIQGELMISPENTLMEAYSAASAAGAQTIILNFARLKYLNSYSLSLLVTLLAQIKQRRQRLLAFGLSQHNQKIFKITGFNQVIGLCDNEGEALTAAKIG